MSNNSTVGNSPGSIIAFIVVVFGVISIVAVYYKNKRKRDVQQQQQNWHELADIDDEEIAGHP